MTIYFFLIVLFFILYTKYVILTRIVIKPVAESWSVLFDVWSAVGSVGNGDQSGERQPQEGG